MCRISFNYSGLPVEILGGSLDSNSQMYAVTCNYLFYMLFQRQRIITDLEEAAWPKVLEMTYWAIQYSLAKMKIHVTI